MSIVSTQKARVDDVLEWTPHQGFSVEEYQVDAGNYALNKGDSLVGHVLIFGVNANPKIVDTTGDSLAATSKLGILLHPALLSADVAIDATNIFGKKVPVLVRMARVKQNGLQFDDTTATLANIKAALEEKLIQVVQETKGEYVL